ncbi:hypothetical protein HDU79_004357 [Rhizoclosmatium sp. JEL0117]|nr:hypothetical protein HDU79_004357 [Rhizoclosmatium sp. JEL0117]
MGAFGGDSELETSGGGGIVTGVKGLLGMKKKAEVVVIKQNAEGSNKNDGNIALDRLDSVDSLEAFETAVIEKQQVVTSPGYATDATVVTNKKSTAIPTQSDGAHPFGFFD